MLLTNSAEGVTPSGTTVTTANSGGASGNAWDVVTLPSGGSIVSDSAQVAHGGLSYLITIGGTLAEAYLAWTTSIGVLGSTAPVFTRAYLYVTANPGTTHKLISVMTGTNAACGSLILTTAGKIATINAAGTTVATSTNSVPLNAWCRVEFDCTPSTTVGVLTARLYLTPDAIAADETLNNTGQVLSAGPVDQVRYGPRGTTVANVSCRFDDVGITDIGPMGPSASFAGAGAAQPGQTWLRRFHHRQVLLPPFAAAAPAVAATALVQPPAIPGRAATRARLGGRGLCAAGILATGIGPPVVPAPHQPPAITHPAPHRAQSSNGQGVPPAARPQPFRPVTVYRRVPHRALWRNGAGSAIPVVPSGSPPRPVTVWRRFPHGALWRVARGVPPAAQAQPSRPQTIFARSRQRALWRGNAGSAIPAGTGNPQPFRPVTVYRRTPHGGIWRSEAGTPPSATRQPFRPPTIFGRVPHRVLWRSGTGPAAIVVLGTPQPSRPPTVWSRTAHRAQWRAIAGTAVSPVLGAPQPFRPLTVYRRAAHPALWRSGAGRPPAAARQPRTPLTVFSRVTHRALWQQARGSVPAAQRQPFRPLTVYLRSLHRSAWRAITGSPAPPPPALTPGSSQAGLMVVASAQAGVNPPAADSRGGQSALEFSQAGKDDNVTGSSRAGGGTVPYSQGGAT